MKEYDQEIDSLQKENFNLKLRIYFLEENAKSFHNGDTENLYKVNISLKMEIENLKRDLQEKQSLLIKAHSAIESITSNNGEDGNDGEVEMLKNEVDVLKLLLADQNKELKEREKVTCDKEDLTALMRVLERQVVDLKTKVTEVEEEKDEVVREKDAMMKMMKEEKDAMMKMMKEENYEMIKDKEDVIGRLLEEKQKVMEENAEMLREKEEMLRKMKEISEESIKEMAEDNREEITASNLHEYVQKLDLSLQHFDKVRNDLRGKKRSILDARSEGDLVCQWSGLVSELEVELCKEARDIKLFRQYIEKEKNVNNIEKDEMKKKFDDVIIEKETLIQKLKDDIVNLNKKLDEKEIDLRPDINKEMAQSALECSTSLEKYSRMEECVQKLVGKVKKRDLQLEELNEVIKNLKTQLELNQDPRCKYNTSLIIQLSRELKRLKMSAEVAQDHPPIESTPANQRPSKVSSHHLMYEIGGLKEECKKRISIILGSTRLSVGDLSNNSIVANSKDQMSLPSGCITQQLLDMMAESEARCALMKDRLQALVVFLGQLINQTGIRELVDVRDVSLRLDEASMLVDEMSIWLSDGKDIFNTTNTSQQSFIGRLSLIGGSISEVIGLDKIDEVAWNEEKMSLENQVRGLDEEKMSLENQVRCLEEEKMSLENQVRGLEEEKMSLENQLRSVMEENYGLKLRTEELQMKVVEVMGECDGEKIRLRGCVGEKEVLMGQVEEMRRELLMIREDLRGEKEAMLQQLNDKQGVIEKMQGELDAMKVKCEEKEEELIHLQSRTKSLLCDLNNERFKGLEKENLRQHHQSMRQAPSLATPSHVHSQSFDLDRKRKDDVINKMESLQLQNDFLERKVAQLSTKSSHLMIKAVSEEDHDHAKCHLQIEQMRKQIRELKGKRDKQPVHSKSQLREEIVHQINKTRQVLAQTAVNLDMAKIRQQVKQAASK